MESTRLQKIERLLQKELSDIFQKQTQGMHGVLVSVSVVRVSPDLSVARAYLSIFPSDKSQKLLEAIRSNTKAIRFDLGQRIRLQVRKIPELSFFIDHWIISRISTIFCISNQRSLESSVLYSPAISLFEEVAQCHKYHIDGIGMRGCCRHDRLSMRLVGL